MARGGQRRHHFLRLQVVQREVEARNEDGGKSVTCERVSAIAHIISYVCATYGSVNARITEKLLLS